ncbi:hypothetical protein D3C87_1510720 [compost metagenome]
MEMPRKLDQIARGRPTFSIRQTCGVAECGTRQTDILGLCRHAGRKFTFGARNTLRQNDTGVIGILDDHAAHQVGHRHLRFQRGKHCCRTGRRTARAPGIFADRI